MGRTRRRLALLVALVLWGLITHGTYAGQGDEPHYLAIAHSIAFDRDFDVANNYGAREPLIGSGGLAPAEHTHRGRNGIVRPVHDVGMPLLFAPYVAVAAPLAARSARYANGTVMRRLRLTPSILYRHLISVAMICIAAMLAVVMFDVFRDLGASNRAAFWTALLMATSPPLLIYGVLFFTELISALCCVWLFRRIALQPVAGPGGWAAAGAVGGLLILVHIKNGGVVLPLTVLAVATLGRRRMTGQLAAFLAGLGLLVGLRTAFTYHFWGSLLTTPHARRGEWQGWAETASVAGERLAGLLFDQEFGLLPYSPILVFGALGSLFLWRQYRRVALQLTFVVACHVLLLALPVTNVHGWTGGWSPAARFLTPVVPLIALLLPPAFSRLPQAIVVVGVAIQVLVNAYMWQNPKNLWNDGDGVAAVCERGGATFCRYLPSFRAR